MATNLLLCERHRPPSALDRGITHSGLFCSNRVGNMALPPLYRISVL